MLRVLLVFAFVVLCGVKLMNFTDSPTSFS